MMDLLINLLLFVYIFGWDVSIYILLFLIILSSIIAISMATTLAVLEYYPRDKITHEDNKAPHLTLKSEISTMTETPLASEVEISTAIETPPVSN